MVNKKEWSSKRVSVLLTIIALTLWAYSITQAKLNIGFFGLIHSFPVTFFIALGILTIASAILWSSKESHQKLLAFQILFFITALWLAPALIGSHPGLGCAYRNLGLINSITEQGHLIDNWYLAWPGAHILFATISELYAVNLEPAIYIFPFLMQLFWLLPLYLFLRNVLGETRLNYCWAGLWLFSLANWIGQEYFSPQAIAFFLLLLLVALITSPSLLEEGSRSRSFLLTGSFLIAGLVISHLLTALAAVCMLAAFFLAKRAKKLVPLIGLCLVLIACWDISGGAHYFTSRVLSEPFVAETPDVAEPRGILVFDPEYILETNITKSLAGSQSHIAVVQIRIVLSSIFAVLGLVGAILTFLFRRTRTFVSILAIEIALLLLLSLAKQFGWELIHRLYLYGLPFMAYFGVMILDMGRKLPAFIICLLLITSCPLLFIGHYGNQAFDYWSPSYLAGFHYVDGVKTNSDYRFADLKDLSWKDDQLVFDEDFPQEKHYFAISEHDGAKYDFLNNQPNFVDEVREWLQTFKGYVHIYANPEFGLYLDE
ncbi:MAG: hypothetical protein ACFFCW_10845 [Candidatus Hodarchaeota archaeon]